MRSSVAVSVLTLVMGVALPGVVSAQATPPAAPAAQAPAAQAPAAQAPAQAPTQLTVPFPPDAKVAYIDIQRIANESAEGKAATTRVKGLQDKKLAELGERQKQLQANRDKLEKSGAVMNDAARAQLEKEIERQGVDIQRATQDAQAEVQELQQELQLEFQRKLSPIIQQVAQERGLYMLFSRFDSGLVWASPGLDITAEVVKRFDAAPAQPAPKPAQ
jgi:outer membrane protein